MLSACLSLSPSISFFRAAFVPLSSIARYEGLILKKNLHGRGARQPTDSPRNFSGRMIQLSYLCGCNFFLSLGNSFHISRDKWNLFQERGFFMRGEKRAAFPSRVYFSSYKNDIKMLAETVRTCIRLSVLSVRTLIFAQKRHDTYLRGVNSNDSRLNAFPSQFFKCRCYCMPFSAPFM